MRFYEIKTIKPLSPEQQRIRNLQQQIEQGRRALAAEREQQRRKRETERQRRAQANTVGSVGSKQ
jgi:uncharacterized protein YlxW (UPF0749 family)